ncbi:hypothetical protein DSO57_1008914, partial [Entomophthora muscae]
MTNPIRTSRAGTSRTRVLASKQAEREVHLAAVQEAESVRSAILHQIRIPIPSEKPLVIRPHSMDEAS